MDGEKKKVSAILYDRFSEKLVALANTLKTSPNELVNRLVEECLLQIHGKRTPAEPVETVKIARTMIRKPLSYGDRLVQEALKQFVPDIETFQAHWREFYLEKANAIEGALTREEADKIKKLADQLASKAVKNERVARKRAGKPLVE